MAFALLITGPPASGKSAITSELVARLRREGILVEVLESDKMRAILTPQPRFGAEEREDFYRVLSYIGYLLWRNGVNVVFDATMNREAYREYTRRLIPSLKVVSLSCSLKTRRKRDVKGLYKAAEEGKITTLPGLQVPFEEPKHADLTIDTENKTPSAAAEQILRLLKRRTTVHSVTHRSDICAKERG